MEQNHHDELIDTFLKKKLTAEDQSRIDFLLSTDPVFVEKLAESKEVYKYLQYLRDQKIRKQLEDFDKKETNIHKKVAYRRWLAFGALFFVALILGWLELVQFCKPENIALRYFEPIKFQKAESILPTGDFSKLELANGLFESGDFENAASLYQEIGENSANHFQTEAKWNILMSSLAMKGFDERWKKAIAEFPVSPDHSLSTRKNELLRFLNSPLYRLGTIVSPSAFSAIKPRLI